MNAINHHDALTTAISLTDEILAVLDEQDFDRLDELEMLREPLIRQAFSQSIQQVDQIKAIYLQKLNHQVVEKLLSLKISTQQEKQHVRHAAKATMAYQSNQL